MDAMAFGMGCCCLQTTYQASGVAEARSIYDHLSCLTPILMAMTACTPFLKGKLSDLDCRWTVIAQSVDDRTDYELNGKNSSNENERKNEEQENNGQRRIYKSRYDTIDSYLSNKDDFKVWLCLAFFVLFFLIFFICFLNCSIFSPSRVQKKSKCFCAMFLFLFLFLFHSFGLGVSSSVKKNKMETIK